MLFRSLPRRGKDPLGLERRLEASAPRLEGAGAHRMHPIDGELVGAARWIDLDTSVAHHLEAVLRRDRQGRERIQVLALAEGAFPSNEGIARGWTPLWSLYRQERDAKTGRQSRSLLWNLWRQESDSEGVRHRFLFGLFRWHRPATPSPAPKTPAVSAASGSPQP